MSDKIDNIKGFESFLVCSICKTSLEFINGKLLCSKCKREYDIENEIPNMMVNKK